MTSFSKTEIEANKDSVLIYVVGAAIQRAQRLPLSSYNLNKTLASIIRHWEWLRENVEKYRNIHEWDIEHYAYRHGQRVFRRLPPSETTFHAGALFIEDIVKSDSVLKLLEVRVKNDLESDSERSEFYFPTLDEDQLDQWRKYVRLDDVDFLLIKKLADIYVNMDILGIEAISTCPTKFDTLCAVFAQINIWLAEVEQLEAQLNPTYIRKNFSSVRIATHAYYAFICGIEIGKKISWFETAKITSDAFHSQLEKKGYKGDDFRAIKEMVEPFSPDITQFREIGYVLSSSVGYVIHLLEQVNYQQIPLSTRHRQWISVNIHHTNKLGIEAKDRDDFDAQLEGLSLDPMADAAIKTLAVIDRTKAYLHQKSLPNKSNPAAIFFPEILIPDALYSR